jgi:hypothetical protein
MLDFVQLLGRRLRVLLQRRRFEDEMAAELRQHLEELRRANEAMGMTPSEAATAAEARFGDVARIKRNCREERGLLGFDRVRQETCRIAPVGSLALAAVLAYSGGEGPPRPRTDLPTAAAPVFELGSALPDFSAPADFSISSAAVDHAQLGSSPAAGGVPIRIWNVSSDFFPSLGIRPLLGRVFLSAEDQEGAGDRVVISDLFWREHFHASAAVIGRSLVINRTVCRVIGVLAPEQPLPSYYHGDIYRITGLRYHPAPPPREVQMRRPDASAAA